MASTELAVLALLAQLTIPLLLRPPLCALMTP